MEKNVVKVNGTVYEERLMHKVFIFRTNGTGCKIGECMFHDKKLAELFVTACMEQGIDARLNGHQWPIMIER